MCAYTRCVLNSSVLLRLDVSLNVSLNVSLIMLEYVLEYVCECVLKGVCSRPSSCRN
jgi:hypothetical protein